MRLPQVRPCRLLLRRWGGWLAAVALALTAVLGPPRPAQAQLVQAPDTYAGDLWSRPRLTGDWGGLRDTLAKRGVVLDVDLLQTLQGVASGGRDTGVEYGGLADYTLQLDTHRLSLWPGGLLKLHAESKFGDNVLQDAGAIGAVNASALFPVATESTTELMNATYVQFLAPWAGVILGKIETLGGDDNEFAHGYYDKFMNLGFTFNLTNALVPVSAYGGGIILVPWEGAVVTVLALDPDGKTNDNSLEHIFENGVTLAGEARVAIKPFGLTGHQTAGFTWSDKERLSLQQDPSNLFRMLLFQRFPRLQDPGPILRRILERFFPGLLVPVEPLKRESEAWSLTYNFDQYVWQRKADPSQGIGVFFRFGISDGHVNPIKYHYNVGVGGKGLVPGRPRDTYGIGWSRIEFSDHLIPFLRERLHLGLNREDAVEVFYNAALTRWLNATLDLQVIEPGLKKFLGSGNQLEDVSTAVVAGLRLYARF